MTTPISNKFAAGLTSVTKTVGAAPAAPAAPTAKTTGMGTDSLVRTGSSSGTTPAADPRHTAEVSLANAYHPDPAVFARNLAQNSLNELVSSIG